MPTSRNPMLLLVAALAAACASAAAPSSPRARAPAAASAAAAPAKPVPTPQAWRSRAAEYLDARALDDIAHPPWIEELHQNIDCMATCHTTHPYLLARPALPGGEAALDSVRASIEARAATVSDWSKATPWFGAAGTKLATRSRGVEAVVDAASLAHADLARGRPLSPSAMRALDLMWASQRADGAWDWFDFKYEPWETGDDCGVAFAASLVADLPAAERSRAGARVERLAEHARARLAARANPPKLHQRVYLLWASDRWPGLLDDALRRELAADLVKRQRPDGGWSMATWGSGKRVDPNGASDGYATALASLALCQGHLGGDSAARGVAWLLRSQHENGAWAGYSLNADGEINRTFEADMATAYAVLAITRCGG